MSYSRAMTRLRVLVLIVSLLFQGLGAAWASLPLAPPVAPHEHTSMPSAAHASAMGISRADRDDTQTIPCHQHTQAASSTTHSAHGCPQNDCKCRALCALAASVAVPVQPLRYDSPVAVRYVRPQGVSAPAPAHTPYRFRPPIARSV